MKELEDKITGPGQELSPSGFLFGVLFLFLFCCAGDAGDGTQGLIHAR